jgi:oxygen-dependent protoporphyrinogen oxidase
MKTAVIGGGIAGLAAAYELARTGRPFVLYEASPTLGGIIQTIRRDGFVVECGPDSWVTEKPWAHTLVRELGLEEELISSNDHIRRTYIARHRQLIPIPDGMRMMVPGDLEALRHSPLFTQDAQLAYTRELERAAELKASALPEGSDESVADFVRRHFGDEVTATLAAPLLAGVFGGSIQHLSVRAVLPAFVKMEREYGSLVLALQQQKRSSGPAPVFTTLRSGLQTLTDSMAATLPASSIRLNTSVTALARDGAVWRVFTSLESESFDAVVLATPADVTRSLLAPLDPAFDSLLAMDASSAIVIALAFLPTDAETIQIPRGFGFLVPPANGPLVHEAQLLACTFVEQKFPHRAPPGAVLLRAFFGGDDAPRLQGRPDEELLALAHMQLSQYLGHLPEPSFTVVRRWPRSLPQYAVGHLTKMNLLASRLRSLPGLRLIGNAYHGVGLPDLIRQGREAVC